MSGIVEKLSKVRGFSDLEPETKHIIDAWCDGYPDLEKILCDNLGVNKNFTVEIKRVSGGKGQCTDKPSGDSTCLEIPRGIRPLKVADIILFESGNAGKVLQRRDLKKSWSKSAKGKSENHALGLHSYAVQFTNLESEVSLEYVRHFKKLERLGATVLRDSDNERLFSKLRQWGTGGGAYKYLMLQEPHDRTEANYTRLPSMYMYELERIMPMSPWSITNHFVEPVFIYWKVELHRSRPYRAWAKEELNVGDAKKPGVVINILLDMDANWKPDREKGAIEYHGFSDSSVEIVNGRWREKFPDLEFSGFKKPPPR